MIPKFFYGTAWKEEKTADLTFQALETGFRAVDTANQRKHYYEEGAGQGIRRFLESRSMKREELFLQTKFTFARGQDHRKPYSESDPFSKQVADSFASSLKHLGTDYLDSYVLHGPSRPYEVSADDLEVWEAMEKILERKQTKFLGVSNVTASQLVKLCSQVRVKPRFVQNRCYARKGWDLEVREVCKQEGILYQGFSLLTANEEELSSPEVITIAKKYGKTIPQIAFRFSQQLGMIVLTGSSSAVHLKQDLDINDFELNPSEMSLLETIAGQL